MHARSLYHRPTAAPYLYAHVCAVSWSKSPPIIPTTPKPAPSLAPHCPGLRPSLRFSVPFQQFTSGECATCCHEWVLQCLSLTVKWRSPLSVLCIALKLPPNAVPSLCFAAFCFCFPRRYHCICIRFHPIFRLHCVLNFEIRVLMPDLSHIDGLLVVNARDTSPGVSARLFLCASSFWHRSLPTLTLYTVFWSHFALLSVFVSLHTHLLCVFLLCDVEVSCLSLSLCRH